MKKRLLVMMLMAVFALSLVACTAPEQNGATTTAPSITTTTKPIMSPTGGIYDPEYSWSYINEFNIMSVLTDPLDQKTYEQWEDTFQFAGGTRSNDEFNVYNLIVELNIPRETVEKVCADYKLLFPEEGLYVLTAEQIEILYTGTAQEVHEYFATPYSLVVNTKAYSPQWFVESSVDAYREAGITAELLEENFDRVTSPCSEEQRLIVKGKLEQLKAE